MVVSKLLLAELARALAYPKLGRRIAREDAQAFLELLGRAATVAEDPPVVPARSRDPGDDYLLALAESNGAILVTGDQDLLALKGLPVMSPRAFLATLPA